MTWAPLPVCDPEKVQVFGLKGGETRSQVLGDFQTQLMRRLVGRKWNGVPREEPPGPISARIV